MLREYELDSSQVVMWTKVPIQENTTYEELPVQILDRAIKILRIKEIPLVKALWQHHGVGETTRKLEFEMQERYPYLFSI